MPRATGTHWKGEHAARRQSPRELRTLKAKLRASNDPIVKRVLRSAGLANTLMAICDDHITWRKQKRGVATAAAANKQLIQLAARAEKYSVAQVKLRSDLYTIQAMVAGLGGDAQFMLRRKLTEAELSLETFTDPYADEADWAAFSRAAKVQISVRRGRVEDQCLICTVARLIELYEQFAGRPFTHTPAYDGDLEDGSPLSLFGRFAVTVMRSIEPKLAPRRISTTLETLRVRLETHVERAIRRARSMTEAA